MTVHLVGAGPGDLELLTLRAAKLISTADVLVHDRLVGPDILRMASPWAEVIDVGKDPDGSRVQQADINEILIDRGRRFETVVRLKGGDPFVFGRGGEEGLALSSAGIDVQVTPGITSALAGPAVAGVPVTHRGMNSCFTVVTGHEQPGQRDQVDWTALAKLNTTLVVLMGARRASCIREALLLGGMPQTMPVAVVVDATSARQHVLRTQLADLGSTPIANPAVIVIGPMAGRSVLEPVAAVNINHLQNEERIHV